MISAAAVLFALLGTPLFVVISALALISFFRSGIDLIVQAQPPLRLRLRLLFHFHLP